MLKSPEMISSGREVLRSSSKEANSVRNSGKDEDGGRYMVSRVREEEEKDSLVANNSKDGKVGRLIMVILR